jgi:DNA-binding NtrC family response regulator
MYIQQVLERTEGNKSHAAQILQISRKTLSAKLQGEGAPLRSVPAGA